MSITQPEVVEQSRGWRSALGLEDRQALSWAMYDWANSAFATTIMAAVFPIFYASVAGANLAGNEASVRFGYTTSLALLLVAISGPVLGAIADFLGAKKRLLAFFVGTGVVFTASFWFIGQGDWLLASVLFIGANIGFAGANIFYDSLLPHVASPRVIDRLSTAGYALGYLGGGILLVVNIAWILSPSTFGIPDVETATRMAMLSVPVWWALFSIPLFLYVREPGRRVAAHERATANPITVGFARLWKTFHELKQYKHLLLFLFAFWLYGDGINTIVKMATIYGTEIGIGQTDLIGALILTQFIGIPFSFAFGWLVGRIGVKQSIYLALTVYLMISITAFFISEAWHFWALASAVALVQGGSQALSRSLFSRMVPRSRSSEFFGFWSVSGKFAGILGPLLFAVVGQLTGGSRFSIISLVVFFVGGMLVLTRVDIEKGELAAREADARFAAEAGG